MLTMFKLDAMRLNPRQSTTASGVAMRGTGVEGALLVGGVNPGHQALSYPSGTISGAALAGILF